MNNKSKYYVRINPIDEVKFENHLNRNNILFNPCSYDMGFSVPSKLYIVDMDNLEELNLKLSFSLIGCYNYVRALDRIKNISYNSKN